MNSIEILVAGKVLDLNEGTSVTMVFNNSLLDTEVLQGSYSLPFNLPATARNRTILGFPEVIESLTDLSTEIDCEFRYEVFVMQAKMKVRDAKPAGYTVNLFTDIGAVAEKLKTLKLTDLELERIDLPPETRPTITQSFQINSAIANGTILVFKYFRQDFSSIFFPVQWQGSLATFLSDLVARISQVRPGVPDWNPGQTYSLVDLVKDASGNIWEARRNGLIGKVPQTPSLYDPGDSYLPGNLVFGLGPDIYEALQPSTGIPVTDTDYWQSIGEEEYWLLIADATSWPNAWRNGLTPTWWMYDDPTYSFDLQADWIQDRLYIYDNSGGTASPFDYILIWSQTIPGLTLIPGLQNQDGTTMETNFRLPIDRMLFGQLGRKWPATNYNFIPYRNDGAFDDQLLSPDRPTRPYVNYFLNGAYQYGEVILDNAEKQFFAPQISLGYVLDKLFEQLEVSFENGLFQGSPEAFDRLVIYSSRAAVKYVRMLGGGGYFSFPFVIRLQDHLPSVSLGEFLNAVRQFLFLGFAFDWTTRKFRVVRLKDVLAAPAAVDWTSKVDPDHRLERENPNGFTLAYSHDGGDDVVKKEQPDISRYTINPAVPDLSSLPTDLEEIGKLRLVENQDAYYLATWSDANTVTWTRFCRYMVPFKIGEGKTNRKPAIAPILDTREEDLIALNLASVNRNWQLISTRQKLAIPELAIDSAFSLRIFFNWGMQPDSSGQEYPYGSSQNRNYYGDSLGSVSLRYDGPDGLVEELGKEWLNFLSGGKRVTRQIRITPLDLLQLKQQDKIRVDRVDYLWKTVKVGFPILKPCEVEFWTSY